MITLTYTKGVADIFVKRTSNLMNKKRRIILEEREQLERIHRATI
jgi:hypothetical protein